MNCNEFNRKLDAFLDGELPVAEANVLEAHVAQCAACNRELGKAHELLRLAALLPRERQPARDLWPGIAAQLEAPRVSPQRAPWFRAVAASALLVTVFVAGLMTERAMRGNGDATRTQLVEDSVTRSGINLREARRILPASHVELIEGNGGLDGSRASSNTEQEMLRNLLLVNLAIRELEAAATADPANANLRELLSSLYIQEHRILGQAERLRVARQAPTRTGI